MTHERSPREQLAVVAASDPELAQAHRHARELEWLSHATESILRQEEPDDVALAALSAVSDVVRAPRARIYRVVGGESRLIGQCSDGVARPAAARERQQRPDIAPTVEALRRFHADGRPVSLPDDTIPICVETEVVAVVFISAPRRDPLQPHERELLDRVTRVAGIALRNAERLRAERERGARLSELERAKSQFLHLASHELRSPMTVLLGYLSLLEDGAFGAVPDAFLSTLPVLNARLAEMDGLINAMLETSRLEDDRLQLERGVVDLREIVDEAVRRSEMFVHPGQALSLRCCDTPLRVYVDRSRIAVALGNLIHNAIKYSVRHTDVRVVVARSEQAAAVSISDQGVGIAAEDMPVLFTRFGRIRNDPASSGIPGTGLGLYLSRELARMHGGDISVESQPGVGSTFTLTLPLAD